MSIANDGNLSQAGVIGDASNIVVGSNPPFSTSDFLAMYPQFEMDANGNDIVPPLVLQMYVDLANAAISEKRWGSYWKTAMGWFIAHFCSLYLQGATDPGSSAAAVMGAGQIRGLVTSESVGDVSVSMDYSSIAQDLDGWAAWRLTTYGVQLATIGKIVGKGGMYIY